MNILIDAYNIVRPHGTGVATYGRNLASAAAGLGHRVDLLFGTQAGHAREPLLREIGLAEGDKAAAASGKRPRLAGQVAAAATGVLAARRALLPALRAAMAERLRQYV